MVALRCSFFLCLSMILITLTDETENTARQKTHNYGKVNKIKRYLSSLAKQWNGEARISILGEVTPNSEPDSHEEPWSVEKKTEIGSDESSPFININVSSVHTVSTYGKEAVKTNILRDYTLWLGAAVGSIITILSIVAAYLTWVVLRKHSRRRRRLDFDGMSTSPFIRDYVKKDPVLDESNNFSIDSNSDTTSSSEEEIFNISGYGSNNSSITSLRSSPKVTMTSTPIKEGSNDILSRSLQTTPTKNVRRHNGSLPISPLARRALHKMGSFSK